MQVTRQATGPAASGVATRWSSLAAGVVDEPGDMPDPPLRGQGGGGGATAPVNRDVPHVQQSGDTLNCTMGNWEGEPTSYAYQWTIDGADKGVGSANYTVQEGDVGKVATCVDGDQRRRIDGRASINGCDDRRPGGGIVALEEVT